MTDSATTTSETELLTISSIIPTILELMINKVELLKKFLQISKNTRFPLVFVTIAKFLRKIPTALPHLDPRSGPPAFGFAECSMVTKLLATELLALEKSVVPDSSGSSGSSGSTKMNTYIGEILTFFSECGLLEKVDPGAVAAMEQKQPVIILCGVACDVCGMRPIVGPAYHCLVCQDFDICESCKRGQHAPSGSPILVPRSTVSGDKLPENKFSEGHTSEHELILRLESDTPRVIYGPDGKSLGDALEEAKSNARVRIVKRKLGDML